MIADLNACCRFFYSTTFLPITHYSSKNKVLCAYPGIAGSLDLTGCALPPLLRSSRNPDYYISSFFGYYGIVRLDFGGGYLVAGPIFSTPVTTKVIRSVQRECAVPPDREQETAQFCQESPLMTFNQFLNLLSFLHLALNDQVLNPAMHFDIADVSPLQNISVQHSSQLYERKEEQAYHNTYRYEQEYLSYIRDGEPEKLKNLFLNTSFIPREGMVADNALRQAKNIFISAATLATRSAIAGGMDTETAYQLSDIYINECEKLQSPDSLANLNFTMTVDFAERVAQHKIPQGMSREIFECVQFISRNTNSLIRVDDVAGHIGRSRSYVSRKFKQELGFDLSSFILRCRLEEARSLLAYSDKPLSEISSYLCFSSQAHFQNAFKKKYGLTPMQYRNQTIHI